MFRRLESSLPKDFEFPANLEGLGYFVSEKDQIRSIANPDQEFHYFISKNERCLEMQREAMNISIRQIVMERLLKSSLEIIRLPLGASLSDQHIPVLTSTNISTAKRIIIYIGESTQDLGIFSYRDVGQTAIASGSALDFIHNIQETNADNPGIVIANLGQLIWHRRTKQAMTQPTWHAIPRKTAVSMSYRMDMVKNRVPRNEGVSEHVACVFEDVIGKLVDKDAELNIVGLGDGALEIVEYLQKNWDRWEARVTAIAVGASHVWTTELFDERFAKFWSRRARGYLVSPETINTPLSGHETFGCNLFSSGEASYMENIMPRAHKAIVRFFQLVADNPEYEAVPQNVATEKVVDWEEAQKAHWGAVGDD